MEQVKVRNRGVTCYHKKKKKITQISYAVNTLNRQEHLETRMAYKETQAV